MRRRISSDDLRQIRAGDDLRFAGLVRAETPYLRRYAYQWLLDSDDVDDVLQTTWYRVWNSRDKLTDPVSCRRWITVVCRNACFDMLRSARRSVAFTSSVREGDVAFDVPAPVPVVADALFSDDTMNAILTLPMRQRLVVVWRYLAGKSTIETAEIMRCSPGTVKSALAQALRSLRQREQGQLPAFP